jgi:hypothetical protein
MATPYRSMAATSEVMERNSSNGDGDLGVGVTKACRVHLTTAEALHIRQTRRRCCQTVLLGCEARTEFKYYNQKGKQIAYSLEDANCCCRVFCPYVKEWFMTQQRTSVSFESLVFLVARRPT